MMVGESGVLVFLYFFMVSHDYPRVMNRIWFPSTLQTPFLLRNRQWKTHPLSYQLVRQIPPFFWNAISIHKLLQFFKHPIKIEKQKLKILKI